MKKVITSGIVAACVLIAFSVAVLFLTIWVFPNLAMQYFNPAFTTQMSRYALYYIHPLILSLALAWFWDHVKTVFTGSFIMRGIEFGLAYALVATFPNMWLIYSSVNVTLPLIATWFVYGLAQAVIAGFIFEKMNP